jgi:tRNA A-37 threonylcarbamoyl transferase component Bud32
VLFLEHVPQTLAGWLAGQDVSAFARVDAQLADTTTFMREHGLAHFDAHFLNILTDGHALYFSDFGLALSDRNRRRFVRAWAAGDRPRDVPASAAAILTRHAGTAVVIDDFHQSLMEHSKQTPYPRAQLERIRARAGQREDFTTDVG